MIILYSHKAPKRYSNKKELIRLLWLAAITVLVWLVMQNKDAVEFYSSTIYPVIATCLQFLLGWIPFSVGDLLYPVLVIILLKNIFFAIKPLFKIKKKEQRIRAGYYGLHIIRYLTGIYLSFLVLWGINYQRTPLAVRNGLSAVSYSQTDDLITLNNYLLQQINNTHLALTNGDSTQRPATVLTNKDLYTLAEHAYSSSSEEGFLPRSTKTSLWKDVMNYMGISGYLNPFTNEAQINTNQPTNFLPFTICHEIAHQNGIAPENEANFAGYLAAVNSNHTLFEYSGYLSAFSYTMAELRRVDTAQARINYFALNEGIKKDYQASRDFWNKYENKAEPYVKFYYDLFLKSNKQSMGIRSYNAFTDLLLRHYKPLLDEQKKAAESTAAENLTEGAE